MIYVKYNVYHNLINIKIGLMDSLYICLIFNNTNIFIKKYIFWNQMSTFSNKIKKNGGKICRYKFLIKTTYLYKNLKIVSMNKMNHSLNMCYIDKQNSNTILNNKC